ncbi:hypothetical protein RHP47_03495 [Thermosynechococcus sp. QKsg1]|uniref:hypothetical protein n=1 Tax=unclassified Thermosynechococcus TaxID=2622553 RepID=UPI00122E6838|nr:MULTISPECIES: hypothetical protein [unclassified Thermosynechococcus]QEQ00532.1 hypothetical protein FFX45_03480 [Thermosynechococcus sp. CL-1]WJI24760.1 hypothetical protein MZ909_03505 [Thermosynechococcus sp. B0]WJI29809.1 hypothetical protein M0646_03540 [Thermosynechococcus sp. B3]WKT84397.1 hypothetical protein QYC28_03480 [Thermosynechococcus sp. HY596]WNC63530.1 hypothetical protein RHK13_03480 [Thermosynechococcus sp. HY591]
MATAQVLAFMQKTAEDAKLRDELENLLGVGDGNISGAAELDAEELAALRGKMAPKVVDFASQHGFEFSTDELVQVVDSFAQHQAGEISDDEFSGILGVPVNSDHAEHQTQVTNPLQRLARYLGKTYLGIGADEESE